MKFTVISAVIMSMVAAQAHECRSKIAIAVGGIAGFTDFAIPSNTGRLRACHVRLYVHRLAWSETPVNQQQKILSVFKKMGKPVLEIDMTLDAKHYFEGEFRKRFTNAGIHADEAHINNFFIDRPMSKWKDFVNAGRTVGLRVMSPVYTPNRGQTQLGPFASPVWNNVRVGAVYGGGLTVDAPSDFFWQQSPRYRQFVVDEIRWANRNKVYSTAIVSPGSSGLAFLELTKRMISFLVAHRAEPNEYVVENYESHAKPGFSNVIGNENDRGTITSVALWLTERK
jgi:hypothetical protein